MCIAADIEGKLAADARALVASHRVAAISAAARVVVLLDDYMPLAADARERVVLDPGFQIALGVKEQLLGILRIVEAHFVEAVAAFRRIALERGAGHLRRQFVRRRQRGVVDAADHERLIRIAFDEMHQHFLSDARQEERPVALAGPGLRDAHPAALQRLARRFRSELLPMKLHLDAAVFVGMDLFAFRPDDHRRLRPRHARARRAARGPESGVARQRREGAIEHGRPGARIENCNIVIRIDFIFGRNDEVLAVVLRERMIAQMHGSARPDGARGRARAHEDIGRLMRLDARACETLGVFVARVARRVLLHRVDGLVEALHAMRPRDETLLHRLRRLLEVVIVELDDACRHFAARGPCVDPLVLVRRAALRAKWQCIAMRRRAMRL
ncbi:hypothetical protein AWB80_07730 [Caballeronia pedi]|uniref:Uncharacterized protein n=1 Tax=Caballeronia pedi TaxID=1777141 RepID=A0A158DZ03_9BURK|nr:hypothetical protein AWB80_07730 [Caballeronia pedi]